MRCESTEHLFFILILLKPFKKFNRMNRVHQMTLFGLLIREESALLSQLILKTKKINGRLMLILRMMHGRIFGVPLFMKGTKSSCGKLPGKQSQREWNSARDFKFWTINAIFVIVVRNQMNTCFSLVVLREPCRDYLNGPLMWTFLRSMVLEFRSWVKSILNP